MSRKFLLFAFSGVFALSGAVARLIGNVYWLNAPVAPELEGYRPEGAWEGVLAALLYGVAAQAVFLAAFAYPVLRLGRAGLVSYLAVNASAAALVGFIYVDGADPANYAGWGYLGIVLVFWAPVILALVLFTVWLPKRFHRPPTSRHDFQRAERRT